MSDPDSNAMLERRLRTIEGQINAIRLFAADMVANRFTDAKELECWSNALLEQTVEIAEEWGDTPLNIAYHQTIAWVLAEAARLFRYRNPGGAGMEE